MWVVLSWAVVVEELAGGVYKLASWNQTTAPMMRPVLVYDIG